MERLAFKPAWDAPAAHEGVVRILVVLAIIATAFNDLLPILPAGELESDAFIYVFPLLLLYLLRRPGEIAAPISLLVLILILFVVLVIGIAANYGEITTAYFKGRSGFSRVITQGMMLSFGLMVTLLFYNLTIRGFLPMMALGARIAILIMAGVGGPEIGSWYSLPGLTQMHQALAVVIHAAQGADYTQRLRMTAFEVSWAAVMLTFLFPFAIMDIPSRNWRLPAIVLLVFVLTILAQSRTALLVLGFQIIILMWQLLRHRLDMAIHVATVGMLAALVLVLNPGTSQKVSKLAYNMVNSGSLSGPEESSTEENVSNVTRYASVRAGLKMFGEHPILGVGLGQYGFNYPRVVQAEDFRSWEVRNYAVSSPGTTWPPGFSLHVRMLAETGVLGYLVFLAMIIPIMIRAFARASPSTLIGRMYLSLSMTLAGWMLLGASIDSFRFFGGWIAMGVGYGLPILARHMYPEPEEHPSITPNGTAAAS